MSRLTREMGLRALGAESCPKCEATFGLNTASAAFAGYTRGCIQEARGAFSIDLGEPLDFVCHCYQEHVFFDYLDTNTVSLLNDEAEQDGAVQSATALEPKLDDEAKPQPESDGRPQ
ncbi:MAG: hypothetical protein R3F19_32865 [Verrucomicrobiales bacterium]